MIATRAGKLIRGTALLKTRTARPLDIMFASHGDSLSNDRGAANYIFQLRSLYEAATGNRGGVAQRGINGISWAYRWPFEAYNATLITDAPTYVDPVQISGIDNWLIAWAGINGLAIAGHSAAEECADCVEYLGDRIEANWVANRIVVPTPLPRVGVSETMRDDYIGAIIAATSTLGCRLARLDLDPDIGGAGDEANGTYYYDGIHLTDAGQAKVAAILYDVIFP